MSLLTRLNAKFGRYGVANVTIALIIGQAVMYVITQVNPANGINLLDRIQMYPEKVLDGEVWRLVTFLFNPPAMNVIFAFFFWYLFYLMGTTLEVIWGAFRYNVFLLVGYIAAIAFAFCAYFIDGPAGGGMAASSAFLEGTVFLAFARLYPDFTLMIAFILPIKIRWLALLQWIAYGFLFLSGEWMTRAMVLASVFNYLLFFGRDIWVDMKHGHRRMRHQAQALKAPPRIVHKCHVCGLTSDDAPQMQFRYCSKCEGEACYCAHHQRDHVHVVSQVSGASSGERN